MPLLSDGNLEQAIGNIARWGDTDIFPFPIDNHMMFDQTTEMRDLLTEISNDWDTVISTWPVWTHSTLAPVGYTGFRWVTQIDPVWNAYLLALTLRLAEAIEVSRIPVERQVVFSYRYLKNSEDDSLFTVDGWSKFQERTRLLSGEHKYVVLADISDFYPRIYHHRVENALQAIDATGNVYRRIATILSKISGAASYGLPVGGPAARILSELTLNQVDRLLLAQGATDTFCRFADDYRIFVDDLPTAYRAIGALSEKLYSNQGLSLQKTKTRVMTSSEYLEVLDPPDPPEGSAERFLRLHLHFDPYSETAVEDYEALSRQIDEFDVLDLLRTELKKGQLHPALTRRLVRALGFLEPDQQRQAILSLLDKENIAKLAPVLPQVLRAIGDCLRGLADDDFIFRTLAIIRSLILDNHYLANVELNLAYMVRLLGARHTDESEILLARLFLAAHGYGSAPSPSIQRDIVLIFAKWRVIYWLSDLKNSSDTLHPWVRRAFMISSRVLGDEGRHWREFRKTTLGPYEKLLNTWVASRPPDWVIPI